MLGFGLWYIAPPLKIFQLYRGGQFYWWRKGSYWHTLAHNVAPNTLRWSENRTHSVSGDGTDYIGSCESITIHKPNIWMSLDMALEWDHAIYLWQWMKPNVLQLKQWVGPEALLIDKISDTRRSIPENNEWGQIFNHWDHEWGSNVIYDAFRETMCWIYNTFSRTRRSIDLTTSKPMCSIYKAIMKIMWEDEG